MDDLVLMHVLDSLTNLLDDLGDLFLLSYLLPVGLSEVAGGKQLHDEVDV